MESCRPIVDRGGADIPPDPLASEPELLGLTGIAVAIVADVGVTIVGLAGHLKMLNRVCNLFVVLS